MARHTAIPEAKRAKWTCGCKSQERAPTPIFKNERQRLSFLGVIRGGLSDIGLQSRSEPDGEKILNSSIFRQRHHRTRFAGIFSSVPFKTRSFCGGPTATTPLSRLFSFPHFRSRGGLLMTMIHTIEPPHGRRREEEGEPTSQPRLPYQSSPPSLPSAVRNRLLFFSPAP